MQTTPPILLVSVMHTGTRYTSQLLEGWGVRFERFHTISDKIFEPDYLRRPAIVPMRNPYHCFLTWWKTSSYLIDEHDFGNGFLRQFHLLDEWLELRTRRKAETIIFPIDKWNPATLADSMGVEYKDVSIQASGHHITDKFIQPIYSAFPQSVQDIATKWGYPTHLTITVTEATIIESIVDAL